jgi:TonB-linked SusC/RagA family outer membrane protein
LYPTPPHCPTLKGHLLSLWFFLVGTTALFCQTTISGTVTDTDGTALIGASVIARGTTAGTVTDPEGRFTLSVPAGVDTLLITYTGYAERLVPLVTGRTSYSITLRADARLLGEIVVTGVGTATDRRRTAISVETVAAEDLPPVASGSVDQALIGRIPGAYIQQSSGQPGQQANILLRGINTLQGTNPMILIDGVQVSTDNLFNGSDRNLSSRLAELDFSNVERVEVVQGAAAATIYGAQGANGVIQIFSKRGRAGEPRVSLNTMLGVANPLFGDFELASAHAFRTDAGGRMIDSNGEPLTQNAFGAWGQPLFEDGGTVLTDKPYREALFDHREKIFRSNILNYRTSLSLSGGSEAMTYSVTGTLNNQESTLRGGNRRINLGSQLGFRVFDRVDVNVGLRLIRGNNETGGITGASNGSGPLNAVVTARPFVDFGFRNPDGSLVPNPLSDNTVNPLYTNTYRTRSSVVSRVIPNVNLNWQLTDFLRLDYKYGVDYYRDDYADELINQVAILGNSGLPGIEPTEGRVEERLREGTLQNSILSAFLDFGSDAGWHYRTQLAFDYRDRDFSSVITAGTGLPPFPPVSLGVAQAFSVDKIEESFVTYGGLINQRVEWQGKVGVSAGVRADYSSAFGEGSDAFVFPRGDVYVRLSEFDFWTGSKANFPEVKLRAAYGQAGVQPGPFDRIRTLTAGQFGNGGFLAPRSLQQNPRLQVQVSEEVEVGADIAITPGGGNASWLPYLGLSVTYWDRTADDVIREIGRAPSTGSATILDNAITLSSSGWQASLTATLQDGPRFGWEFTTNFSRQRTVLDAISNGVDIPVGNHFLLQPGEELGTLRGLVALTDINARNAAGDFVLGDDRSGFSIVPESGYVVDAGGNVQFGSDIVTIGNGLPDFNMSFINEFRFGRGVRLGFQLDWVQGFDVYNQTKQWSYRDNVHGDVDDPVTINGQSGAYLSYYRTLYNTNNPNSAFVEDGSFLRLRTASASVDLTEFFPIGRLESLRLQLTGFNLFTLTDYSGFDPEAASNLNDPTRIGLDEYAFPNSRIYQFGLNVEF